MPRRIATRDLAAIVAAAGLFAGLHALGIPAGGGPSAAIAADPECGNAVVEDGEQCDDGNLSDGDCCSSTCQYESSVTECHDGNACTAVDMCDGRGTCVGSEPVTCPETQCLHAGTCDPQLGCVRANKPDQTACDDGDVCSVGDQCVSGACLGNFVTCGDGTVQSCEQCDDGNTQPGDGCSAICKFESSTLRCQERLASAGFAIFRTRLTRSQRCRDLLNRGRLLYFDRQRTQPLTDPADCPNEFNTATAIAVAAGHAGLRVAGACSDSLIGLLSTCAATVNGVINEAGDAGCLVDAHNAGIDAMLGQEYGRPLSAEEIALQKCQQTIAKAGAKFAQRVLKSLQNCRNDLNKRRALYFDRERTRPLVDPADCLYEYRTQKQLSLGGEAARKMLTGGTPQRCTDEMLSDLAPCASTLDAVVSPDGSSGCLIDGHRTESATMVEAEY